MKKKRKLTDRQKFSILYRALIKMGFCERKPEWAIENDYSPPDVERMPETYGQISMTKNISGYEIVVHTGFNPDIKEYRGKKVNGIFAKKGGYLWIHINDPKIDDPDGQSLCTRARSKSSLRLFLTEVRCFVLGFQKVPKITGKHGKYGKKLSLMLFFDPTSSRYLSCVSDFARKFENAFRYLRNKKKVENFLPMWVPRNNFGFENRDFADSLPEDLRKVWIKINRRRNYYQIIGRKKKGVVNVTNEIRTPWDHQTPKKIAPIARSLSC